jgi:predicted NBD/HSP70 family sugar kinase
LRGATRQIVDELTRLLARGIACVVTTLTPAAALIGGTLSRAGESFVLTCRHLVEAAP